MTDFSTIDPQTLLNARLWVARLGERDVHNWWQTDGVLGPDGAFVGPRVLPKTHATGRARIVFAVARHACNLRYPAPGAEHLFQLDPVLEDRLDALLVDRLADVDAWAETMTKLEALDSSAEIGPALLDAGVTSAEACTAVSSLPLGPEQRSLPIDATGSAETDLHHLIAGFTRSTPGHLAVPYLRRRESA